MRVALLYEHPTWSTDLLARMRARGIEVTAINVGTLRFALPKGDREQGLWINRVNALPSAGRPASVVAATSHFLLSLELSGQRVVNGSRAYQIGGSKAAQSSLFAHLGLHTPASIGIHSVHDAKAAATQLGFPVLTKPNIGGSGGGILRHETIEGLEDSIVAGAVDLGIDGTGLVQKLIESADGLIHRVEMLGSELLYATQQMALTQVFNYCAADGSSTGDGGTPITLFTPPPDIVERAADVMRAASADVAAVEYMIDRQTGQPCFFDFNPYSNFITGYDDQLGFNPVERYLDHVLDVSGV